MGKKKFEAASLIDGGTSKQPSYYELLLKSGVMLEVHQIAIALSVVSVFFYGSYDLHHALNVLVQYGFSSCTAQRLLLPAPHLIASALLVTYFFFRASNYRAKATDWCDLIEYLNHEDEIKDFSTGQMVKRKGRLFIAKFGGLLFAIVMPFVIAHLSGYFHGDCKKYSEHINDHINFFEGFLILTFPTYFFILIVLTLSREKADGK